MNSKYVTDNLESRVMIKIVALDFNIFQVLQDNGKIKMVPLNRIAEVDSNY